MAYPCSKASFGGSVFRVTDDRTIEASRDTTTGAITSTQASDNTGKDPGTVRNRGTAGTYVSKGGRDANSATIGAGY